MQSIEVGKKNLAFKRKWDKARKQFNGLEANRTTGSQKSSHSGQQMEEGPEIFLILLQKFMSHVSRQMRITWSWPKDKDIIFPQSIKKDFQGESKDGQTVRNRRLSPCPAEGTATLPKPRTLFPRPGKKHPGSASKLPITPSSSAIWKRGVGWSQETAFGSPSAAEMQAKEEAGPNQRDWVGSCYGKNWCWNMLTNPAGGALVPEEESCLREGWGMWGG